jgi:hypothetical protein
MLEAWDRMRQGAVKAGLDGMRHAVDAGGHEPEFVYGLARALLVNGQEEEGRKAADRLCELLSGVPEAKRGWMTWAVLWAWGALWSGRGELVEPVMQRAVELTRLGRGARADAMPVLVVCALRQGNIHCAKARLDEMLADNPGPGTLIDAAIDLEFGLDPSAGDDVRQFVKRAKGRVRRADPRALKPWSGGVDAAVAELAALCQDSQPGAEQTCRAVTVLLLASAGRWREAIAAAHELAATGASRSSRELLRWSRANLAGELLADLRPVDASRAPAIIRSFLDAGLKSPDKLAADWRTRLDVPAYWHLSDLARVIPSGRERRLLSGTIANLEGWLDERLGTSVPSSLAAAAAPTPIVLELGRALIPPDAVEKWEEWELFTDLIPSMRTAIETQTGVNVPAVNVRSNELLADGDYVILLSESPFEGSSVPLGHRWAETPPAAADKASENRPAASENGPGSRSASSDIVIDGGSHALEQRHPLTGRPGTWTEAKAASSEGIDPLRFIMADLEAVLRSELHRFVVVDEVARLVESWVRDGATPELRTLAGEPDGLRWLTCVLRRLALDGLPLRAGPLTSALAEDGDRDVDCVVRRIRRHMRQELPGNRSDAQRLSVPEPLQAAASFRADGSLRYSPDSAWDLVQTVDRFHAGLGDTFALVVSEPDVALAVRRLLQDEVGSVAVILAEELLDG